MKGHGIAVVLLVAASLTGCDKVNQVRDKIPFLARKADTAAPVTIMPDTATAPPVDTTPPAVAVDSPAEPVRTRPAAVDEPWTPEFTGTVNPGMTREEVVSVWGEPVTERSRENFTYLYYRNGCEVSCGTFDVVFLENGQVVDAVVRGQGHDYSGNSSSPPGRMPEATPPQPLTLPTQSPAAPDAPVAPAPSNEAA